MKIRRLTTIEITTLIEAPIETCFELSLSIDLEANSAKAYCLHAVDGVVSGKISGGQRVKWKARQFGIAVTHLSEITAFQPPSFFQDSMVAGLFKSFQHDHFFEPFATNKTEMRDCDSVCPCGFLAPSPSESW